MKVYEISNIEEIIDIDDVFWIATDAEIVIPGHGSTCTVREIDIPVDSVGIDIVIRKEK